MSSITSVDSATESNRSAGVWRRLNSLADPIGLAGTFAGVLGDRLVVGGGSQISPKPLWLGGGKVFSDRIFTLTDLSGEWAVHPTRLPKPMAHFATAANADAIYLVGGSDATGYLREVYVLRPEGDGFTFAQLADLPRTLIYGAATLSGDRLYVAGGQQEVGVRSATNEVWSIQVAAKTSDAEWEREPDLPNGGLFVGAMAASDGAVYFVGGVGFDEAGKAVQSKKLYALRSREEGWVDLPDMPEPRVGALTPCPVLADGRIFVVGGYAVSFPGAPREHPGFSPQTFFYDIADRLWQLGPVLPHVPPTDRDATSDPGPAPMVAAAGAIWRDHVVVVSGEVRASVRTPAVMAWRIESVSPDPMD